MGKKLTSAITFTLLAAVALGGVAYLSSGFSDWTADGWQDRLTPDVSEEPPVSSEEPVDPFAGLDSDTYINVDGDYLERTKSDYLTVITQANFFNGDDFCITKTDIKIDFLTLDIAIDNGSTNPDIQSLLPYVKEENYLTTYGYAAKIYKFHKDMLSLSAQFYFEYLDQSTSALSLGHFGYIYDLTIAENSQVYDIDTIFDITNEANPYVRTEWQYV